MVGYQHEGSYQGAAINNSALGKKRPGTGTRRNQLIQHLANNKRSFANKNPSTMELEVHRLRPKLFVQDRERLFDDAMKQKMAANSLRDENVRLRTRIHVLESELARKDKFIDELLQ